MSFNAIFNGPPQNVPSPGSQGYAEGIDVANGAEYFAGADGWTPVTGTVAQAQSLTQTGAVANVLTYAALQTGVYVVRTYTVQATATSGTLPTVTVTGTDPDLNHASTVSTTGVATTGEGQSQTSELLVAAKAGTNIVVATGAPTSLTYNVKTRISFLG